MGRSYLIVAVAMALLASAAAAQQRDDGEEPRRPAQEEPPLTPGFGEVSGRPAVPKFGLDAVDATGARNSGVPLADRYHERVVAYAAQILERYDRNQDGKLQRDEWTSARWRSDPASSDANKDGVLTLEELCERVKGYDEFRGLSGSAPAATSGGASNTSTTDKAKLDDYAKGLMKRYDDNDNGVLEADEYQEMSSFHRGGDANGDKVITRDELAVRLANYGNSSGSSDGGSAGSNTSDERGRDESRASSTASSKGYRTSGDRGTSGGAGVRTATERLPKGLPDWFARNDADGDGQISMAEFAVSWTADKIEEFSEHDANGDGLITPQECLSVDRHRRDAGATRDGRSQGR